MSKESSTPLKKFLHSNFTSLTTEAAVFIKQQLCSAVGADFNRPQGNGYRVQDLMHRLIIPDSPVLPSSSSLCYHSCTSYTYPRCILLSLGSSYLRYHSHMSCTRPNSVFRSFSSLHFRRSCQQCCLSTRQFVWQMYIELKPFSSWQCWPSFLQSLHFYSYLLFFFSFYLQHSQEQSGHNSSQIL